MSATEYSGTRPSEYRGENSSEYRGINNVQVTPTAPKTQTSSTSTPNYATVIKTTRAPKKDQAIVMDAIEGYQVKDYLIAIIKLTESANIRFISRIANNRICVYLSSKQLADELIDKKKVITLGNETILIRPLISRSKRIILSNVCPVIPHEVVEQVIKNLGVKMESTISYIRAGFNDIPGSAHILSFRRQLYVHPDDVTKIPESIQIDFEDTKYWIFTTAESPVCFICKKEGHIAIKCPENQGKTPLNKKRIIDSSATQDHIFLSPNTQEEPNDNNTHLDPTDNNTTTVQSTTSGIKRAHSTSTISDTQHNLTIIDEFNDSDSSFDSLTTTQHRNEDLGTISHKTTKTKKSKKKRIVTTEEPKYVVIKKSIEDLIQPIKHLLDDTNKSYPLDYLSFKNFLDKAYSSQDPTEIAKDHVSKVELIPKMMRELYPYLTERSAKNRFSRIIKKIEEKVQSVVTNDLEMNEDTSEEQI